MSQHRELALWAADCAERVLGLFETENPDDPRPRLAIDAARRWQNGSLTVIAARKLAFAAHAAAREATGESAVAAARSAGHAAATAHVETHAPHAASYARKAKTTAGEDGEAERFWQRQRLGILACDMK
jgi:hypothetical protein